jgi:hypothetical protein
MNFMPKFDFKSYHFRAMNASSENEKLLINSELKAFYEELSPEEKAVFNEDLEHFLIKQLANIKSVYDGAAASGLN